MTSYNVDEFYKKIYIKRNGQFIKLMDKSTNKEIIINLKDTKCPFGLEKTTYKIINKEYNSLILKINLEKKKIKKFVTELETKLCKLQTIIDNKKYKLNSQILNFENYENKLITKIKEYNNKILTKIYKDEIEISLFDINKGDLLELNLSPNIYINKELSFTLKWTIKTICVK